MAAKVMIFSVEYDLVCYRYETEGIKIGFLRWKIVNQFFACLHSSCWA